MRIRILSDLHLDLGPVKLPKAEADVVVLAGDVRQGKAALTWIRESFPEGPVVYVLGNHEFYGGAVPKLIDDCRRLCAGTNIHLLENDTLIIDGVRFLGCTLWTDFGLFGDPALAGREAAMVMNDYRLIRVSPAFRRLQGRDTAGIHWHSRRWLGEQFSSAERLPTVVVTHHAPSARSLHPEHTGELINAAYASNLDELVNASHARLWIHGHIHRRNDYHIGATHVISNPRGYSERGERAGFDPTLVVDL